MYENNKYAVIETNLAESTPVVALGLHAFSDVYLSRYALSALWFKIKQPALV